MEQVLLFIVPAVLLAGLFFLVWRLDARRSNRQDRDSDRQDVKSTGRPGRRRKTDKDGSPEVL